jgi:2,4-dichlorophenol 6-monooxygenase
VVADKYHVGRVFAVGDSAHRHPPTGGLGLNSALHDVQNLCWKVAYVLRGQASPELLSTYGPERRPVDARNVERSLENSMQYIFTVTDLGLGDPETPAEENWDRMATYGSNAPEHADARRKAVLALQAHTMEFHEHDVEYGYEYESSAVIPDGSASQSAQNFKIFTPEARPGHPLPHAWIDDTASVRRSTLDLVDGEAFTVIAGEDGAAWLEAAKVLSSEGFPLNAVSIGHLRGDYFDARLRWEMVRGHGPTGAILVRPDRCVAFRAHGAVEDATQVLRQALAQILGKPVHEESQPLLQQPSLKGSIS